MNQLDQDTALNIYLVPVSGKGPPRLLIRGPTDDLAGALSPDGRQLLFVDGHLSRLWRVNVESGATLRLGTPTQIATFPPNVIALDATPDHLRFLVVLPERTGPGTLTIVQSWRAALNR